MKKTLLLALLLTITFAANAQDMVGVDSLVYRQSAALDSTLAGKSIFNLLPSKSKGDKADVKIHQSQAISSAFNRHIASGRGRTINGYRVRIYFDNTQYSRSASEAALHRFLGRVHGIPAYRSYQNPFFKVTVGDFRTRSEAMELLERIKGDFPSAFIVKEKINYPVADRQHSYVVDTVRVYRQAQ